MYEDKTKYGEQIPSMFSWITPEEQKKRAEKLEHITEKKGKIDKDQKEKSGRNEKNRPG